MVLLLRGSKNGRFDRGDDEVTGRVERGASTKEIVSNKHVTTLDQERLCERLCI